MAGPLIAPQLASILRGKDILHFADNQGANFIAIKGYSSAPDLARIVSVAHHRLALLQAHWWVAYVPSAMNPADAPSRGDLSALQERGAIRIDFTFPSLDSWTS